MRRNWQRSTPQKKERQRRHNRTDRPQHTAIPIPPIHKRLSLSVGGRQHTVHGKPDSCPAGKQIPAAGTSIAAFKSRSRELVRDSGQCQLT